MSTIDFFASSKVLIVAGKGGVGKSTVGAALGVAAASAGYNTLLIELEGHSNLAPIFGCAPLSYSSQVLVPSDTTIGDLTIPGQLKGSRLTPDQALLEYLDKSDIGRFAGRLARSGVVELVATAAPGIRDVLTLGKVRQLEEAGAADLIIVDAPAAGHAITFLQSASGLADSVSSGPVRHQADLVLEMLTNPSRSQAMLVTLPEETPVTELLETADLLAETVGVALGPAILNNVAEVDHHLEAAYQQGSQKRRTKKQAALLAAAHYQLAKQRAQQIQLERAQAALEAIEVGPVVSLPHIPTMAMDLSDIGILGAALKKQLSTTQTALNRESDLAASERPPSPDQRT